MYIAEKAIDVLTLGVAAILGSKVKIFEENSKLAKGRNLSHSPVKRLVSIVYAIVPPNNTPIEIPTDAAVFLVIVDNIRASTI